MKAMKFYNCRGKKTIQNNYLPDTAGVYFIWSKDELLYIGCSIVIPMFAAGVERIGILSWLFNLFVQAFNLLVN